MLLFANKMGVHWYFQFVVKMADNKDTALLPITATKKLNVHISLAAIYLQKFLMFISSIQFGNSCTLFIRLGMYYLTSYVYLNSVWR